MTNKESIIQSISNSKLDLIKLAQNDLEFRIWNSKEIQESNKDYNVEEFLPGYLGIGASDGEILTINLATGIIYSIPFVPMETKDKIIIAKSLDSLIALNK